MTPKILLLTTEPLPIPGLPATGAGLRAWGLGFGLRSAGFDDVTIAFAADAARGRDVDPEVVPGVKMFERGELDEFIEEQSPDAIVFQHWGLFRELKKTPKQPVAMDLAGPHLLERRLWQSPDPEADFREKIAALAAVDFTVCSGEFQRHYFLPFLVQAGHDPRQHLCPVIPFSVSPEMPEPDPERERDCFVFGGMFLPWQDPEPVLRRLLEVLDEKDKGRLLFIGGAHPGGDVSGGRFQNLLEFLEEHPRVEMRQPMPFDEYLAAIRQCGAAVDLMPRNAERELAFPTRTMGYLWAGLPVIHNDYDELAEPIAKAKAGWTLDPNDEKGLRRVVTRLLGHHEDIDRRSEKAQALVAERYTWDKTIGPLADWCSDPQTREQKQSVSVTVAAPEPAETAAAGAGAQARKRPEGKISYAPPRPVADTRGGPWYLSPVVFVLALPVSAALVLLFGMAEVARIVAGRR